MKRSHFSSEQFVFALRQAESGTPVVEVCRKMLDQWVYLNGVKLDFSRHGKPTDNP